MKPYIYPVKQLITSKTNNWCKIPYPGHPKGCPKYGESKDCPPQAPNIEEFLKTNKPMYLVHSEFNLEEHARNIKSKHPDRSDRQCRNLLYWQPKSRGQLKQRVREAMMELGIYGVTYCPEGMGVNVYATALKSGLRLERIKDLKICRHVALMGSKRFSDFLFDN